MSRVIPFESRAHEEERLYREFEAAYFNHMAMPTPDTRDAMVCALDRWKAVRILRAPMPRRAQRQG